VSASNFWLVAFIICLALGMLVTCSAVCGGSSESGVSGGAAADPEVDLEAVVAEYKRHVKTGSEDLAGFEKAVNERKLYKGEGHVTAAFTKAGAVVGFVDADGNKKYSKTTDRLVFRLEADKPRQQLIASDRHRRHYRIGLGEIAGLYLMSRMFTMHHGFYGGWHNYGYRSYQRPGYYRTWRPSHRRGSSSSFGRSSRRSSWGSRSSGWGGGWGGGGK